MRAIVGVLAGLSMLSGCAPEKQLYVSDAWVRLAAVPGRPAAGYFTIHGGPTDATLITVATDIAIKTEMHETKPSANGQGMTMATVRSVPIPALGTVAFAPGGKHVMLFDLDPSVKPGGSVTFIFAFADGLRIEEDARVIAPGDAPPK